MVLSLDPIFSLASAISALKPTRFKPLSLPPWSFSSKNGCERSALGYLANPFPCHTSRISTTTSLFATHAEPPSHNSFVCHVCDTRRVLLLVPLLLALLFSALLPPSANAWGCKGHQTVALIAEKHLTPEARQTVQKLLGDHPIDPKLKRWCGNATNDLLVDASTWPDDIRNERNNGPWHYIDIPRGKHSGELSEYCGSQGCVTRAIEEQLALLKDKSADPLKRAEAIRYLVHFVGDLHQPLHAISNADNGGNCVAVKYFHHEALLNPAHPEREDYSPNLHQVWDTEIIERDMEVSNPGRYADELDAKFQPQIAIWEAAGIHLDKWAWESHQRAETSVYDAFSEKLAIEPDMKPKGCSDDNHIGKRMFEKHLTISDAYQAQAAIAAETGLAEAGVRLALILNEAAKASD